MKNKKCLTYATNEDEVYSSFKMVKHPNTLNNICKKSKSAPICLQIDPFNLCNHNCEFCAYRSAGFDEKGMVFNDRTNLSEDVAFEVIRDAAELGVKSIEATGGGEPTLAPYFSNWFREAGNLGMELALVTNGQLLRNKMVDNFVGDKMRWIRFSMDATTPETHYQLHFSGNDKFRRKPKASPFNQIIENLKYVVKKKEKWHSDFRLGISYIITPHNIHEINKAPAFFKELGVDNIRFSFTYDKNYDGKLTNEQKKEVYSRLDKAKEMDGKDFKVFGWNSRLDDYKSKNDFNFCSYQYGTMQISASGGVYACCIVKERPEYEIGNVNRHSLKEILLSQEREVDFNPSDCPPCWLKSKNQLFNALSEGTEATKKLIGDKKYDELQTYKESTYTPHVNFP